MIMYNNTGPLPKQQRLWPSTLHIPNSTDRSTA